MKKVKDWIDGVKRKFINSVTQKGVKTICHPRSKLEGHISITKSPKNYFRGFYIDKDNIEIAESGGLIAELPKKSNIRDVENDLDKLTKEKGGYRASFLENSPSQSQKSWIDGQERFMATKNETTDGVSFILRADIANEITQKGKYLIQCDESFCDILMPTKVLVDLNKYSVNMEGDQNDLFD
jgi:hypothetical protein